jgi:hypothetical protein
VHCRIAAVSRIALLNRECGSEAVPGCHGWATGHGHSQLPTVTRKPAPDRAMPARMGYQPGRLPPLTKHNVSKGVESI